MAFINWEDIDHKQNKTTGHAKLKCPACSDTRKNKTDKSLVVYYSEGFAKCFHCEGLSFRDNVQVKTERKQYKLPVQTWKNYTNLSDGLVKYLEDERGIKQFTANALGWTEEMYYQPAINKQVKNLVFNYFEGDVLVNKKYRDRNKHFTQTTKSKSILYNINSCIGAEEVYITEGEIDVASIFQELKDKNIGYTSVPNGANNNDEYWINSEPYLKTVKKFYICTDMDEKGEQLAEFIAQRLGRHRCERVLFEGKDANEDLKKGVLGKTIYNTKKYPVSGTFTVNDLYDKMLELYRNGLPPVISPKHKCFGNISEVFTVMRGHLVTGTGIPSHGKSNFTEWYVMNLLAEDIKLKASFFSPEHQPMELHQSTFVEKFCGKNYFKEIEGTPKATELDIAKYSEWANERLYLTSPEVGQEPTWDWLFQRFTEQMYSYGVDIFVIDAWNKVEFDISDRRPEREKINSTLRKLSTFAQQYNVIIILIAHPTKMQKEKARDEEGNIVEDVPMIYSMPDLYDVSGSADFRNQSHDGYCVYRFFPNAYTEGFMRFVCLKIKMKFQGEMGAYIDYNYHAPSGRYYVKGTEPPTHYLVDIGASGIKKSNTIDLSEYNLDNDTKYELPKVSLNDAFGSHEYDIFNSNGSDDDDVPF